MEKEKIRLGLVNRKITTENISYDDVPKEVRKIYEKYYSSSTKFTLIKYNGGGKLVNYGLNSFIRDIYVSKKGIAIYSDRFDNYYIIEDKEITSIMIDSKVLLTSQGIILFYTNDKIYATLNCKVGCIGELDNILGVYNNNYNISRIFYFNKNTYIGVVDKITEAEAYYLLNFSFNLYEAYGTQIEIKAEKLNDGYTYDDIINGKCFYEIEEETVSKSDRILEISAKTFSIDVSEFKKRFGKKIGCLKRKECIDSDISIEAAEFSYDGDIGVNDCINSFVKSFAITKPYIKESFWRLISIQRNVLFQEDRFGKLYIYNDNINDIFNYYEECKFYISLEGVIVAIYNVKKKLYISVSLDGIVWKKYNVNEFVNTKNKIDTASLTYKYCKNCLILYKKSNDNDNSDELTASEEYFIDFTFDFWNLYSSPVEAKFTVVEL